MLSTTRTLLNATLPESVPLLDIAIQVCERVKVKAERRNRELSNLLDSFKFRLSSEKHEGRVATEDWMKHFNALFANISTHLDAGEDSSSITVLRNAKSDTKRVAAFRQALDELHRSIAFE